MTPEQKQQLQDFAANPKAGGVKCTVCGSKISADEMEYAELVVVGLVLCSSECRGRYELKAGEHERLDLQGPPHPPRPV